MQGRYWECGELPGNLDDLFRDFVSNQVKEAIEYYAERIEISVCMIDGRLGFYVTADGFDEGREVPVNCVDSFLAMYDADNQPKDERDIKIAELIKELEDETYAT